MIMKTILDMQILKTDDGSWFKRKYLESLDIT